MLRAFSTALVAALACHVNLVLAAPGVDVAGAQAIYKANACASCHQLDRKVVGPAYRDIAAKYRGSPDAQAHLEKVVRNGGAGVWGAIPMPSHPRMSDADIRTVVAWILAGAPDK
jgi:cytochrome c